MGLPLRAARIDLSAIVRNLRTIEELVAPASVLVDVSADAYGHGAAQVARAVQGAGARSLVVATVAEAVALRRSGIDGTILAWLHPAAESFQAAAEYGITVAVSTTEHLAAARAARVSSVQLAVTIGDSALGCPTPLWGGLVDEATRLGGSDAPAVTGVIGLPPRRTPASRTDVELLRKDRDEFRRSVAVAREAGLDLELTHTAGSAAAITGIVDPHGAVRIGRALFGLSPFADEDATQLGLIAAMTVTARVIGTKTIAAGEGISYGYTYRTSARSNLALVSIGYAHGIDRYASNTGTARLNGRSYLIAGRVAMDVFVLDLGMDTAAVGDEVVLFGDAAHGHPSAAEWARPIGKSAEEAVVGVTPRVVRTYPLESAGQRSATETIATDPRAGGTATIDLGAYRQNLARLRSVVAPAELMAMIKGNAYGHGLLPMARTAIAEGITRIGVLETATGLELRAAGVGREVSLFAWLLAPDEDYRAAIEAGIDLGISDIGQLRAIGRSGAREPAMLHLKIDTGLHRNGATEENWPALVSEAIALEAAGKARLCAAWTHIAEASEAEDSAALQRFQQAIRVGEQLGAHFPLRHLAASAAGYARADCRFDIVRMGAFTFGISPGGGVTATELGLLPVMTLSTQVAQLVPGGMAVIPLGYAQGVPSGATRAVPVTIAGTRYPIVAVERNHSVIDISASPEAAVRVGETVVIFGRSERGELTLQEWADALGTIGEELVVRVGRDVPRVYVG